MAERYREGQRNNRNRPRQTERRTRDVIDVLTGTYETESQVHYPHTAQELLRSHTQLPEVIDGHVGLVATELEIKPGSARVFIPGDSEPIRDNEKVPAEDLLSRDELQSVDVNVESSGDTQKITGQFSVEVETVLVVDGKPLMFAGGSGHPQPLTALLQELPGDEMINQIHQNYLIIGQDKQTKETKVITPASHHGSVDHAVIEAKEHVMKAYAPKLSTAINKSQGEMKVAQAAQMVEHTTKVAALQPLPLGKEFRDKTRRIEVQIGETHQVIDGFMRFDSERRIVTIARPVAISLKGQGLSISDLKVFDATGRDRQARWIDPESLSEKTLVGRMVSGYRREQKKREIASLPGNIAKARLLRSPYATPPQFI